MTPKPTVTPHLKTVPKAIQDLFTALVPTIDIAGRALLTIFTIWTVSDLVIQKGLVFPELRYIGPFLIFWAILPGLQSFTNTSGKSEDITQPAGHTTSYQES